MRTAICSVCGQRVEVITSGPLPSRCKPCAVKHELERNRQRNREARENRRAQNPLPALACADCGADLGMFSGRGRPKERCEPCRKAQAKAQYRKDYERHGDKRRALNLAGHYRRKYGITVEERDQMLDLQGGKCAICQGPPNGKKDGRLHVDHCHATNRIRGLLCYSCNTMLGLAADDPQRLLAAVEYLKQ